ncbi:MAG TPA: hypothetical protein VM345_01950 [Acidimicrobiales bacterium]|nr:hypothetical protein [Acidimicrobiales bacterium]
MLPALASVEDFTARLGRDLADTTEAARVQALLEDASVLVRQAAGLTWVDENGDLVEDVPDVAVMVTLAAARRAFDNPSGVAAKSVDDVSITFSRGSGLYLLDEEKTLLAGLGGGRSGLWTISTTRGDGDTDRYLDVVGWDGAPSEPIPFLPPGA